MTRIAKGACLGLGLLGGLAGCNSAEQNQAVKATQEAVDLKNEKGEKKVEQKHDYLYVEEKKVVDAKTGAVVSDKKSVTPVTIDKTTKTNVDVKAGETQVSGPPGPK